MEIVTVHTSQNIDIDYDVAGLGERILAYLLDGGIFLAIYILGLIVGISMLSSGGGEIGITVMVIAYLALYVFYDLLCEVFMGGQSIGKRVLKIKVISLDGGQPTIGQYLLRWMFRILDFSLTGGLCALITVAVSEKRQRVGDMVAGTTLIKTTARTKMDKIAFAPVANDYQPIYPEASQLSDRDVVLIHEVVNTYLQTGNSVVVYNMADRIREHLNVQTRHDMDDLLFLQTVVKDYNYTVTAADTDFNV